MNRWWKIVWWIVFGLLTWRLLVMLINLFRWGASRNWPGLVVLLGGMLAYGLLWYLVERAGKRSWTLLRTFRHEFIHYVLALLSFRRIGAFQVNADGSGMVHYRGPRTMLITLGPYAVPLFSIFLTGISLVLATRYQAYGWALTGFLYGFELHSIRVETSPRQPDLQHYGVSLSMAFIGLFNVIALWLMMSLVMGGWGLVWRLVRV